MIIVNPAAGAGAVKKRWPKIKQELKNQKIEFDFVFSKEEKHVIQLVADAVKKGFRQFIGVGGDGTLNEITNGIFIQNNHITRKDFKLAVIPCGTGNDWIKTHEIENNTKFAIHCIKNGVTKFHDVGIVETGRKEDGDRKVYYFMNVAGIGFNSLVIENTRSISKKLFRSKHNYIIALIISLIKFIPPKLLLTIDDKQIKDYYFAVNAGICKYNGGGMKIVPHAHFDDGKISLTIVENINKWKVISNFFNLFDGSFVKNKEVQTLETKKLIVSSPNSFGVEIDGELLGNTRFVTINNMSKAIQVISTSKG